MDTKKQLQNRIDLCETHIRNLSAEIEDMTAKIKALQEWQVQFKDELAAIKDARAGIYDKWYRYHREDNSHYDTAWEVEKRLMLSEGYTGEWNVIDG